MADLDNSSTLEPFLMRFATDRTTAPAIGGRYCDVRQVWLVTVDGDEQPIVQADQPLSEIQTKTRVETEEDDNEWSGTLELNTKTYVNVEQDDEKLQGFGLLEIATKTNAEIESDDDADLQGLEGHAGIDVTA